ncbi:MAG: DnaD domain protein [Ruminiclostridium sp.]|nr:DnaD domain protein [Ruminiclostridium sp.]
MDHRINLGAWRKVFAVPSCIADEHHLKLASGTQIKVLLYLLAYPDVGIREENIASELGISKEDVSDALLYWVNAQILTGSDGEYYPSEAPRSSSPAQPARQPVSESASMSTPEARAALSSETQFPPKTIAGAVNGSTAIKCLFDTYDKLAGRPTKHAERQTLMVLIEEIGLPCEVAMMLIEYCFNIDKATPAYMKTVALDWIESGIDDIPKAEERIKLLRKRHSAETRLKKKFGMTTAFSQKQKQMIAEWNDMGISEELLDEAYDITLNNTGKPSFPYMDKVLREWLKNGITDPSMIESRKKAENAEKAPSYNTSEIEQRTYNKYKDL